MASNDEAVFEPPAEGPVAFLIRTVHAPALPNAQSPIRVIALCVALVCTSMAPQPYLVIGCLSLLVIALSLGVSAAKGKAVTTERTQPK